MVCTNGRVLSTEKLDTAEPSAAERNLRDLVRINTWLGGHRILLGVLGPLVRREERFSVLDVGAASGDMGACIGRRYPNSVVVSLDRQPSHLAGARPFRVTADAFQLPFPRGSFDFVTCALVLHHYRDPQIVDLMAAFRRIARRALIIIDLERHPLAYCFLPATRWLLWWHDLTVSDGCASVEAGFRATELAALARAAGASKFTVRRHHPWFRLSLVAPA